MGKHCGWFDAFVFRASKDDKETPETNRADSSSTHRVALGDGQAIVRPAEADVPGEDEFEVIGEFGRQSPPIW
jgi:hypothetical protein